MKRQIRPIHLTKTSTSIRKFSAYQFDKPNNFKALNSGVRLALLGGMNSAKSFKTNWIGHCAISILACASITVKSGMPISVAHEPVLLPNLSLRNQIVQSNELLRRIPQLRQRSSQEFVYYTIVSSLPESHKREAGRIARAIIEAGNKYDMDPFFIIAVIRTESHFDPDILGSHGEIGLMQIRPNTAKWVAKKLGLKGEVDLRNPEQNVAIGAAHLARLRKQFLKRGNRYLAAYNMGVENVRKLLRNDIEPSIYSSRVILNYQDLYARYAENQIVSRKVANID